MTDQELFEQLEPFYAWFQDLIAVPEVEVEYHCPCMLKGNTKCESCRVSEDKGWEPLSTEKAEELVWNCYFSGSVHSSLVSALNSLRQVILQTFTILNIEHLFRHENSFYEWAERFDGYQRSEGGKANLSLGESPNTRIDRRRLSALRRFQARQDAVGLFRHVGSWGAWYYCQHRYHLEFTHIAATSSYHFPDIQWVGRYDNKGFTEIGPTSSALSFIEGFRDPYDLRVWVLDVGREIVLGAHLSRAVFDYVEGLIREKD